MRGQRAPFQQMIQNIVLRTQNVVIMMINRLNEFKLIKIIILRNQETKSWMVQDHKMTHKLFITFIFFILIFKTCSVDIKSTKISSTRNANRANICSYYSATFTQQQRDKSKTKVQQFNYMTDQQIQKILFYNDYSSPSYQTVIVMLPHAISLVVLFFLVPALFCCCVWPQKYPLCKTWRKPENQMYSKCQLKWPAYSSLVLYLIIVVGALIALVDAPNIVKRYNDVGCKNAAIFDDLLYGRLSAKSQTNFFVGLQPFRNQLTTFNSSKLATFFSDSSNSLSTANQVRTKQALSQATIQNLYTTYFDSLYTNAFYSDASTTVNVNSAFKTMYLGPTSNSSTILGNMKSKLQIIYNQVNGALDDMITAWNGLSTTTQAGVRTQILSTVTKITSLRQELEVYLNSVGSAFYKNTFYNQIYTLMNLFYGLVFGLAILGLIGNILLAFCTVVRTRLIMYFTCASLTTLGILGFGFLAFLGFMQPQMSQVCAYVDKRIQNGNQTKQILRNMGYANFADRVGGCMADGLGVTLNTINSTFSTSFDQINLISKGTLRFNQRIPSFNSSGFDDPFISAASVIQKVKNAQVWDLNDNISITHVNKVVGKTYTKDVSCNAININNDVWMPSFFLYSCPAGKAKMPVCSDLSQLTTCPAGCYEILNQFVSPSGDPSYISNLASRYSSSSCNYFKYITNLHDNWNVVRRSKMDSLQTSINALKITVNDYSAKANLVKAGLNSFKTTLETNLDSMTNLTSGSFNGMNCQSVGESLVDYRNAYCIGLLDSVTFNIVCLCLICYGILLLACMVTCAGMRHFKHLQKMQMHVGYKGTPISLSDTRLIDK